MNDIAPMALRSDPDAGLPEEIIPLCEPEIRGNEWKYIKECLDTKWVSSAGPAVERFETAVVKYVGAKYGVATANGTTALHIALLVSGIRPEEEVLVSTLTFIAPANAIRYVGAWPIFMDADPIYWQMDPEKVANFLKKECSWQRNALYNKTTGRRVKAILTVHILGHPCDMDPIVQIARKYNLVVIEDASESLGARYKERMVGQLADIACFSFNGNKIITTGGGGMILTDNEGWATRARYLTTQAKNDPVESIHNEIGYNYRLTNIQAALGCAQMEKLDEYVDIKRGIARAYAQAFSSVPGITCMQEASWARSIFWIYSMLVDETSYGMTSRALLAHLQGARVETRPLWQPLHRSPAHKGAQAYHCDFAEALFNKALRLPSSVGLTVAKQQKVIEFIRRFSEGNR